jgi:hypothetical protein
MKCLIKRLFPTPEKLRKYLTIDLDKQEIIRVASGKVASIFLIEGNRPIEKRHLGICFTKNGRAYKLALHRLFFYWHYGYLPKLVDHKDNNPQNNKIENLRDLNKSGNALNSSKRSFYGGKPTTSIYKGVHFNKKKNKWISVLRVNGKTFWLGAFDNEDDAGQAYNDKIRELGLEEISVLNDTPQERARKVNLFNEEKLSYS